VEISISPSMPMPTQLTKPTIQENEPALPSPNQEELNTRIQDQPQADVSTQAIHSDTKVKRELEPNVSHIEGKKQKKEDSHPEQFADKTTASTLLTELENTTNKQPNPSLTTPKHKDSVTKKSTNEKKIQVNNSISNKENNANFDWQTKINISSTNLNRTSSLIASISTSSKPTTPERKRQKNEIITRILGREADRKTLRETIMNVEQIKEELNEEAKATMSSAEVLHLCEVSWFNKFRDN